MYEPRVKIVDTNRKVISPERDELNMILNLEVDKQEYASTITHFYDKRIAQIDDLVSKGYRNLKASKKAIRLESAELTKNMEHQFYIDLRDMFLQKLFRNPDLCCNASDEKICEDKQYIEIAFSHVQQKLTGSFGFKLILPTTKIKSSLFGQKKVTEYSPCIQYYYYISAFGQRHDIDRVLEQYVKSEPVPLGIERQFVNGERIILSTLKKTYNSDFEIRTIGMVKTEEYDLGADNTVEEMNGILFAEKKDGLLGKLAFDLDLTHEIISNGRRDFSARVENRKHNFEGQITLKREDDFLPSYLTFTYNVVGKGQMLYYGKFLQDYWPSAQIEDK